MFRTTLITTTALALSTFAAQASTIPADLSTWIENGNPNNGAGNWVVQSGNDAVIQTINGRPTVFFESGTNAQGTALRGTISVNRNDGVGGPVGDDDFIGFVLGYQDGEINSTNADFWLFDWKQRDQNGGGAGTALSHVSGNLVGTSTSTSGPWWQHDAPVKEITRGANLGSTGYDDDTEYTFDLIFSEDLIQVKVDGVVEINYTSADNGGNKFSDGAFGFYNFSQAQVTYGSLVEDTDPGELVVPLPAGLPLLLAGLGVLGLAKRRQKA